MKSGSQFDDDYKTSHVKTVHSGKPVERVKPVGAPLNPFETCKRKTPMSSIEAVPVLSGSTN